MFFSIIDFRNNVRFLPMTATCMLRYNAHVHVVLFCLLISPLVVKRSSEVVFNLQVVWDNWLKWIPHLDPVKEPLTPVTLVKVVLLIIHNAKKEKVLLNP